ncbi:alpha/beta hydrolase [Amycolatopsis nigrescens]|uniref:alpha/beta hydrolase n=1 Tax=Amycolatopsis nigrescens TaxID=381445 RepID=UPI00036B6405|nr:alpha/beta hydrolase [Amycolatopsis nigrescens]
MRRRLLTAGAVAVLAVLVPTACTAPPPGQSLDWRDCAEFDRGQPQPGALDVPGVECAWLTVPLDYANPEGETARIGVLRHRATGPKVGTLVWSPGGGLDYGMRSAAALAGQDTELGRRFDLIGFDRRGLGASTPTVRCYDETDWAADRAADLGNAAKLRRYAEKCLERNGRDVLATLGTREVAKDLDLLRAALGERRLDYYGASSGTRLGISYAEQFPGNLRTLVLDSPIGTSEPDPVDQAGKAGAAAQRLFDEFLRDCQARPDCPLGTEPARGTEILPALLTGVRDRPVPADGNRTLSFSDSVTALTTALGDPGRWDALRAGLTELAGGTGTGLLAIAEDAYRNNLPGYDLGNALVCVDGARTSPSTAAVADREFRAAAPFLAPYGDTVGMPTVCPYWPIPPTFEPHLPRAPGLASAMVLASTGDHATPYQNGVDVARGLNARLLTFEDQQHVAYLHSTPCVDDTTTRYLVDAALPPQDLRCPSR